MKRIERQHIGMAFKSPHTPDTGLPNLLQDCVDSNYILRKLVDQYGMKFMTTEEKEGREIHDVIPIKGKEADYSNEGSAYFPFHVEVPHYPLDERPDYIIFLCVRGCKEAKTLVIDLVDLLPILWGNMTEADFSHLYTDSFLINTGVSFGERQVMKTAILHDINGDNQITLDLAEMFAAPGDEITARILKKVEMLIDEFYNSIVIEVNLQRGDMLLIDNKHCVHARNNYSEAVVYDGTQRWLKRGYLKLK